MTTAGPNDRNDPDDQKWYEAWFERDEYKVVYGHRDDDEASLLIDLIEATVGMAEAARVLDMGCGRGRHAVEFARRGYQVTGIDLSPRSIAAAQERASLAGIPASFAVGDMRESVCTGCFDVVANLFTAFGYFDDESEHAVAISAMAEAVAPRGWLVQDFLNADRVARRLVPFDQRTVGDLTVVQRRQIAAGRINKTIELSGSEGTQHFSESVRLLDLVDFDRMYRAAGLVLTRVFGDYSGGPLTPDSPRLIMFSQRTR